MTDPPPGTPEIVARRRLRSPQGFVEIERADGRTAQLARQVADEQGIRIGVPVGDAALDRAEQASAVRRAWQMAMRLLTVRDRSEAEFRRRLARERIPAPAIEATVKRLHKAGHLDDAAFARAWVEARGRTRPRGRVLLQAELRAKGVDDAIIESALDVAFGDEIEIARPLAERRARQLHGADFRSFRQRLGAYLMRRGFESAAAESLVTELWERFGVPD